ncbi:Hypothetical predicted protein, partial [Paramuricea clavata]
MSPGVQPNLDNMFLAQTAQSDYEELCRMDVLGIQDTPSGDQKVVHEEFLEQLRRDPRLKKTDKFDEYNSIIQDQLEEGVVEPANEQPTGTVFYATRFHWLEDKDPQRVLQCHLNASKEKYPKHAEEIEKEFGNQMSNRTSDSSDDTSFAKQQLGNESKAGNLLGLKRDKKAGTIEVTIPSDEVAPTKRGILGKVARIYDPLGLIAPTVLQ